MAIDLSEGRDVSGDRFVYDYQIGAHTYHWEFRRDQLRDVLRSVGIWASRGVYSWRDAADIVEGMRSLVQCADYLREDAASDRTYKTRLGHRL